MRISRLSLTVLGAAALLLQNPGARAESRKLSLAERIAAQRAIERVYFTYQEGGAVYFEEAVPDIVIERKVRDALKQSVALETYWRTSITGEMLRREIDRMN